MTTAIRPMTIEEFMELPEPDEGRLELIAGEVVYMSGGDSTHGRISGMLLAMLGRFVLDHRRGHLLCNANFHLQDNPAWAPVPDLAYASSARYEQIFRADAFFAGAPDLAVEVVSKSNRAAEISAKVHAYLESGAARVWVVEPVTRSVTVYRSDWTSRTLHPGDALNSADASFSVDGFELPLSALFSLRRIGQPPV